MKSVFLVTELARIAGLSRSTLLYYDRIGLLRPSARSEAGYRRYTEADRERLATICTLRQAGLSIDDIRRILSKGEETEGKVLQKRLRGIGEEIRALQTQQHLLARMLQLQSSGEAPVPVDKKAWTEMLRAAGMDDAAMMRWHSEFEKRAPEAHHHFLLSLGVSDEEAQLIRRRSSGSRSLRAAGGTEWDVSCSLPHPHPDPLLEGEGDVQ